MAVDIKVPSVGEAITEGVLAKWLKADGDAVREGEPLYELETDKASQEVSAPASGVLKIGAKEGQKVAIGAVVGRIEEGAGAAAKPKEAAAPAAPAVVEDKAIPVTTAAAAVEPLLSPSARQLVADEGVDPRKLAGTGRGGRVIKEDVQAFLSQRSAAPPHSGPSAPRSAGDSPASRPLSHRRPTAAAKRAGA